MGKFMKVKPKCLACATTTVATDADAYCGGCAAKGDAVLAPIRDAALEKARSLRSELADLEAHCGSHCSLHAERLQGLPPCQLDAASQSTSAKEVCPNLNCHAVFRRVRVAKQLATASASMSRLKIA